MEGWRPVEDIVRWGFGQAPVVMANEFHSGLARCVRTRVIGARMIRAAHEAGVRRLAMEALGWPGCGDDEWIPMGWNFREPSGIDPFVIDQTVTVNFSGRPPGHADELLEILADTLAGDGA